MYNTEEEIINGCLRKKRRAQKALFEKYQASLMGVCMRYSKNESEAEDILLMGFTRIFRKIQTYSGRGSLEGWMRKIIIHIAIDNYRKNSKHYFHKNIDETSINLEYADYIPDNLTLGEILKAIQNLPDGYRVVFNLFAIEGYSHQEIANMLHITESTSKTQYLKARKKLQTTLSGLYFHTVSSEVERKKVNLNFVKPLLRIDE